MKKSKFGAKGFLALSLVLILICCFVVSAVQTNGGDVKIKTLKWESDGGIAISANLYIPSNASADNPAPAIVTSHGAFNNKEMQDANCVELARRGFVVMAEDMLKHGNSDNIDYAGKSSDANPIYESVKLLARLPYVDKTRIGVTGHSAGGMTCSRAVLLDNEAEEQLIAAVLLNSADAIYVSGGGGPGPVDQTSNEFVNVYGSRDVGIISCVFDEFFHKSTDENGNPLSSPYFMDTDNAQSFLYFGQDPSGKPAREAFTVYSDTVDGESCIRVIYRPRQIHPWSHFSARSTSYTIQFFSDTLNAPKPLPADDQVWQWKEAFNFVGLIGFTIFVAAFTCCLVKTSTFGDLAAEDTVEPTRVEDKGGKLWFWGSLVAGCIFAMVMYLPMTTIGMKSQSVTQTESLAISLWAMACGLFTILCMVLSYYFYGKKHGLDPVAVGMKMPLKKLGKSILLAITVICVSVSLIFFADYFFKADFRIWTLALKTFEAEKIGFALWPYLPLFLIYYVAISVSINCFNYNQIGGKLNAVILALFAALPAILMLSIQYGTYFNTNHMAWMQVSFSGSNPPMYILWMFPMVLILSGTALVSRAIYKATKNPYIAGIISGTIVTLLTVTNTSTTIL